MRGRHLIFDYLVFQFEQDNDSECYQWHEWLYDESVHGHRPGQHSSDRSRGVDTGQVWIQSRLQSWGDTEEEGWNKLDGCVLVRYDCVIVMIYSKITVPRMLTFNLYQRVSHLSWVKLPTWMFSVSRSRLISSWYSGLQSKEANKGKFWKRKEVILKRQIMFILLEILV